MTSIHTATFTSTITDDGQLIVDLDDFGSPVWIGDVETTSEQDHKLADLFAVAPELLRTLYKVHTLTSQAAHASPLQYGHYHDLIKAQIVNTLKLLPSSLKPNA